MHSVERIGHAHAIDTHADEIDGLVLEPTRRIDLARGARAAIRARGYLLNSSLRRGARGYNQGRGAARSSTQ